MLGTKKIREQVQEKVLDPIGRAVTLAIAALTLALIAILAAVVR